jgi:hypothetical protein
MNYVNAIGRLVLAGQQRQQHANMHTALDVAVHATLRLCLTACSLFSLAATAVVHIYGKLRRECKWGMSIRAAEDSIEMSI